MSLRLFRPAERTALFRAARFALSGAVAISSGALAQGAAGGGSLPNEKVGGSANIHLVAHIPLGGALRVTDADIEQELSRPYAYLGQQRDQVGLTIIDLRDLRNVKVLYKWRIDNLALHEGLGAMRPKYFKLDGRYYVALCTQFAQGSPDADLGAIIFDVTGLPDTSKVKEVARVRYPRTPGGFHNLFPYKHSDGRVLLFTTTTGAHANVYDLAKVLHGDMDHALIDTIPVPQGNVRSEAYPGYGMVRMTGFHDFYVAFDPATQQDKFYGAGGGGYYVYDVTHVGSEGAKSRRRSSDPRGSSAATRSLQLRTAGTPSRRPSIHATHRCVELGLERLAAQHGGALAVRLRVRLRRRVRGLQHAGPRTSAHPVRSAQRD
jgi:hypothetical protein